MSPFIRRTAALAGWLGALALIVAGCAQAGTGDEPTGGSSTPPSVTSIPSADSRRDSAAPTPDPGGTSLPGPTIEIGDVEGGGPGGHSWPADKPPKTPTDNLPSDILVGVITQGGTGPCYSMETNDGKLYALYGGGGRRLHDGDTVRVKFTPLSTDPKTCAGTAVQIIQLAVV